MHSKHLRMVIVLSDAPALTLTHFLPLFSGLPHAHIVIWVSPDDKPRPDQIDDCVVADVPDADVPDDCVDQTRTLSCTPS